MKPNRFVVAGIALSLVMSAASLAVQLKKASPGFFSKYAAKPHMVTELEWQLMNFQFDAIKEHVGYKNGMQAPTVRRISDDLSKVVIRVMVSEISMPSEFAARKQALNYIGMTTVAGMNAQFPDLPDSAVEVEFFDFNRSLRAKEGERDSAGVIAVYKNSELVLK